MKNTIDSNCTEFGYELLSVLPYAYSLHQKGALEKTISGHDTSCLYFFSPRHEEISCSRSWDSVLELRKENFPNINIHKSRLDWDKFSPPPFKEYYSDKKIVFKKETLVIFNRYNNEWGGEPINYLDNKTLDKLFGLLSDQYQVVYLNLNHDNRYFDHLPPLEFNDLDVLNKYKNVLTFKSLGEMYPQYTINELQCRIFSNCTKYISSNGGQLIFSAYFGGENIIFSKKCQELKPEVNSFYRWYDRLGGGLFHHVGNYEDLIKLVTEKWVDKQPLINILIRTSGRPKYFKNCIESIYNQTYKNWNIIVGVDDVKSREYVQPEKCKLITYDYSKYVYPKKPDGEEYGVNFKYNLYINELHKYTRGGYCLILDDDNILSQKHSLERIVSHIRSEHDLIFWKVDFNNRIVPSDTNFGNFPTLLDIDTAGFMFPTSYFVGWEPFKRGDYRVSTVLYNTVPNKIWVNDVLTGLQRMDGRGGMGKREDIGQKKVDKPKPVIKQPVQRKEVISTRPIIMGITGRVVKKENRSEVTKNEVRTVKTEKKPNTTQQKPNPNSLVKTSSRFLNILPNRRLDIPIISLNKKK